MLQQGEHLLRLLVGDLQHRRAGLHEDLSPREVRRCGGEVGVLDRALGGGQVVDRVGQSVDVGLQRVGLEGAEPASQVGDLVDGPLHDLRRAGGIRSPSALAPPDCRLIQAAAEPPRLAELTLGMPSRTCSADTTLGPNWKLAPPPVMLKLNVLLAARAELSVEAQVQVRAVERQIQTAAGRLLAVDRRRPCRCPWRGSRRCAWRR